MHRIKFSLVNKVIISVVIAEFAIMLVIDRVSLFNTVNPPLVALLDTLILGVVIIFIIKHTFRPLKNMIRDMDEIRKGNLDIRLDVAGRDEISVIADQINHMVSGIKDTYNKIRESEKVLTTITDGIDEEIMLLNSDFKILWANKKVRELSRLEAGEIIGDHCYRLTHHLNEPCKTPLDTCPIFDIKEKRTPHSVMHTHFDKAGNILYVEVLAYPLIDEKGQVNKFIHISRDVTERMKMIKELEKAKDKLQEYSRKLEQMVEEKTSKLTRSLIELASINEELKKTQSQLIQSGKMAALGQLATGVAHEINNPLAVILNNVELIKLWADKQDAASLNELNESIRMVEEAVLRCKKITQALLSFSHISTGQSEPVAANEIIKKIIAMAEYEMGLENIGFEKLLQPDLPMVLIDPQSLQQVFLNIIVNSRWAIKQKTGAKGGTITIKTGYKDGDDFVSIDISDSGIGIPKEHLNRIFEAFFTTKAVGDGTGLGLSIVYNIIKKHKGDITVESREGRGAEFKIRLPVAKKI